MYKVDKTLVERVGFHPYYIKIQSELGDQIKIDGKGYINLASNNYLGISNNQEMKKAAIEAIEKYGLSMCGTPIATGYIDLYEEIEKKSAKFVGLDQCIIFPSCYQANNGIFSALVGGDDLVIVDHFAHSSIIEGVKASKSKMRPFLHNNMDHLEKILKKREKYKKVFVVTESVFSTEGSIAPLKEIVELCKVYDAVPIVDDSHGIGVIGKTGHGAIEYLGEDFHGLYTASLGKALGNIGGIVCGDKDMIEYLRYYCSHLIYSTAITPASLAGIGAAYDLVEGSFHKLLVRANNYKEKIETALKNIGVELTYSKTLINSIRTKDAENTIRFAKLFYKKGMLTTPFIEPSVPKNEGKLRLIAGANLSEDTIHEVIRRIHELGERI